MGILPTEPGEYTVTAPATDAAKHWDGWGTGLKPAYEIAVLARAPIGTTVAENVLQYGVGALNVAGCQITSVGEPPRWPANVILSHSEDCAHVGNGGGATICAPDCPVAMLDAAPADQTNVSRFLYRAKASRSERDAGLPFGVENLHPTVKPIDVMRWLVRLVTPLGGVVYDPFMGSGSTGCATMLEGLTFEGSDLLAEHVMTADHRIRYWHRMAEHARADAVERSAILDLFDCL